MTSHLKPIGNAADGGLILERDARSLLLTNKISTVMNARTETPGVYVRLQTSLFSVSSNLKHAGLFLLRIILSGP